ncbi:MULTISPECIES: ssl1498 family light-harvesting-like protein [unclassified Nodularia (in: cyanobacteria)]|uniref:photosystem II assembly protein Psb34 n=1 Tax=unclassified Nodularia (in: cyanobacteria) TaxID=2656917 RepID=UPI00187FA061|nr:MULTISPECIES: ssl1498 family light-harvesting-like protein [unclassified Nodularia (in: cyanobacteria)]MBE9201991.1 ssl1498 family light-harvesting-like protein [Nodularia sp. LEGE 06071]MCC2694277.1 ssl1498 family light-harvesting-like protein [Nodularia sp. LEGE 04288]
MYTTINESGILNNYATEPKMYCATYPNKEEQRQYTVQAAFGTLLVTTLILVALSVS